MLRSRSMTTRVAPRSFRNELGAQSSTSSYRAFIRSSGQERFSRPRRGGRRSLRTLPDNFKQPAGSIADGRTERIGLSAAVRERRPPRLASAPRKRANFEWCNQLRTRRKRAPQLFSPHYVLRLPCNPT